MKKQNALLLFPVFGTILFVTVYLVATAFYPGGSQADANSMGFSWINNYWCNLLNEPAMNGQHNPARPIAIAGMLVLFLTLTCFWIFVPLHIRIGKITKRSIQVSGIVSMTIALLLFTSINHDLITNLSSIFGLIATIGLFIGLYSLKWFGLFSFGLLNILFVALNNYFYYNSELLIYLPIVQKITFATFLSWICSVSIAVWRKNRTKPV